MCYNGWLGIAVVLSWDNTFFYLICFVFILFLFVVVYVNLFILIIGSFITYISYLVTPLYACKHIHVFSVTRVQKKLYNNCVTYPDT